jgi:hypothetical protein
MLPMQVSNTPPSLFGFNPDLLVGLSLAEVVDVFSDVAASDGPGGVNGLLEALGSRSDAPRRINRNDGILGQVNCQGFNACAIPHTLSAHNNRDVASSATNQAQAQT